MFVLDIDHLVDRFVLSAKVARQAGFEGVELHVGHGCVCSSISYPPLAGQRR